MGLDKEGETRYSDQDRQFWHEVVMPALENLKTEYPDDPDLAFLGVVIQNRQFLNIRDWKINIDGVTLRVSPEDTQDSAQAKLGEFLGALDNRRREKGKANENEYTSEDQQFWRGTVMPTVASLQSEYGSEPGFRLLQLMCERRMLIPSSKKAGINITVAGVTLTTSASDSKVVIQQKLGEFLQALRGADDTEDEIGSEITSAKRSINRTLKGGWRREQISHKEGERREKRDPFRYEPADQLFWREVVIPHLKELKELYPDNAEFQDMAEAIEARQFLVSGARNVSVETTNLEIVKLRVKAGDPQDVKQEKLGKFLTELRSKTYRYTESDQDLWRGVVIPNLEALLEAYPGNAEFIRMGEAIHGRRFLTSGAWHVPVKTAEGETIALDVEAEDSQDIKQDKLGKFLITLREKTYTPEDKSFWRGIVIPALHDLIAVYPDNLGIQILNLTIQDRLFLEERNLDVTVSGVRLKIQKTDTKVEAQEKLRKFLDALQEKSQSRIVQKEMELRIERLQQEVKDATRRAEVAERKVQTKFGGTSIEELKEESRRLKAEVRRLEDTVTRQKDGYEQAREELSRTKSDLRDAERRAREAASEASSLRNQGYSRQRSSYSSSGE